MQGYIDLTCYKAQLRRHATHSFPLFSHAGTLISPSPTAPEVPATILFSPPPPHPHPHANYGTAAKLRRKRTIGPQGDFQRGFCCFLLHEIKLAQDGQECFHSYQGCHFITGTATGNADQRPIGWISAVVLSRLTIVTSNESICFCHADDRASLYVAKQVKFRSKRVKLSYKFS